MRAVKDMAEVLGRRLILPLGSVRPPRAATAVLLVGALLAFLWAESRSFRNTPAPVHSGDEGVWAFVAQHSVLGARFWTAERPFTVPLLYKLANNDESQIVRFQSLASVCAWFALAVAVAACFQRFWLRAACVLLIAGFSLSIPINQWDYVVRSESLMLSLLALTVAATVFAVYGLKSGGRVHLSFLLWYLVILCLLMGTRDSMAYSVASLALACLIWMGVLLWRGRAQKPGDLTLIRSLLVLLVALGGLAALGRWSTMNSARWHTPLLNVLLQRVLPSPSIYQQWRSRYGLPANAALEAFSGKYAWDKSPDGVQLRTRLPSDPCYADVQAWLLTKGPSSLQKWLVVAHPVRSWREALSALNASANDPLFGYGMGAADTRAGRLLSRLLFAPIPQAGWVCVLAFVASAGCAARVRRHRTPAVVCSLLLANALMQAFICFHGDAAEVARHMLTASVFLRLGLMVAALAVLASLADSVMDVLSRSAPRTGTGTPTLTGDTMDAGVSPSR